VRLQQEHVVAVEMRAHAAAVAGVTDHHIIQPRVGHEAELLHEPVHALVVQVHTLHQQRPVRGLQCWQRPALERPAPELPSLAALAQQARLDLLAGSQIEQGRPFQQGLEARDGLSHQQRFLLPMALHELLWGQATEQLQGLLDVHGTILHHGHY